MKKATAGRSTLIQAVQTPLGFFVLIVLVSEAVLGAAVGFREAADRTYLIKGMVWLLFVLVVVVAVMAVFRPGSLNLAGKPSGSANKVKLFVGPPKEMPDLNIASIDWKAEECFIVGINTKLKEKITLVPSKVGPTFRVQIPSSVSDQLGEEDVVELRLEDEKGNRWKVRTFSIYENLLHLSLVEGTKAARESYREASDEEEP